MAVAILLNSKTQRPSVCNAAETLLVHAESPACFLPSPAALRDAGVTLHGDERMPRRAAGGDRRRSRPPTRTGPPSTWTWTSPSAVVDALDEAVEHIRTWSTGHTEAIVTRDLGDAERFIAEVDSAAVMVNASTRFTDGGELGLGAEIGISTQKLHARGPMGLTELTTTKWIVQGEGQIRA